ncbi:AsmA family protein [Myxococcota bacterium]|nr:AsmA family protein [Myxococcota bacterium]
MKKKILKGLGALLLLSLIAVGALVAFFDFDEVLNAQKDKYVPELEKLLGRKVDVGAVETSILPVLGASLKDVVIHGRTPDEPPLLRLDRVMFEVELWTAIASAGSEVRLAGLLLDGLAVNLVREADGKLSYEDILARFEQGPPPDEQPKPLDPEAIKFIKNLQLDRIALENGRFNLIDKATGGAPAETSIQNLLVELDDVHLISPFELHVSAAIQSEADNFDLRVKVGPVPIGEAGAPMPIHWVKLNVNGVELGKLAPYLGPLPISIDAARFSSDLKINDPLAIKGAIDVKGHLTLAQLALGGGQPFDLKIAPNLKFDPKAGDLDLEGFEILIDEMALRAGGRAEGLISPRPTFKALTIKTEKMHLGQIMARVPDIQKNLPKGMVLDGGFSIDAEISGDPSAQDIKLAVDLNPTIIHVPGAFAKGAGVPLNTQIDAHVTQEDLDLKDFRFAVGSLNLGLKGTVKNFKDPTVDIKGGTGRFGIGGVMRLLPNVQKAIPPDVKIAGNAEVDVNIVGSPKDINAKVVLGIYDADLAVPGTTVRGSGTIAAAAKGNPASNVALNLNVGLTGLNVVAGEAFKKPSGTPLEIVLEASKSGQQVNIATLDLKAGTLVVQGSGSTDLSSGHLNVNVKIPRFSVAGLTGMLPALKETPIANATLGMDLGLTGNPSAPKTVVASMDNFYFGLGASSLTGQLKVKDLDAPNVRFDFNSPNMDLDAFMGGEAKAEEPPAEESGPPPPIVKKIDAAGSLRIAKGQAQGAQFKNFVASLTMKNGVLKFSALDFDAYDGHFSAAPTSVNIGDATPSFDLSVVMKNINANKILTEQAEMKDTVSGRMGTDFKLKGRGKVWAELAPTLTGQLGMSLAKGALTKLDLEGALVGNLAKKLKFIKRGKGKGTQIQDLAGKFTVSDGKMKLQEPMRMNTAEGPIDVTGHIGLDSSLKLKGDWQVSPKLLKKISGGKIKVKAPVPIGLTIGGTMTDPNISGINVDALVKVLGEAYAKQLGLEKLADAEAEARKLKQQAERELQNAKRKAEAEARRLKKEAEDRVKQEAEKAKKKAKDKAKEEAKKRLKGLL